MAALPAQPMPDPTLDAARAVVEQRAAAEASRGYLGMSSIGRPCDRQLWYDFRWAGREAMDCDALWRIEDGHRSEDAMAARLRLVPGVQLLTVDPRTGQQFAFADLGGHFRGHADGLVTGILQAPKALHVWEAKAVGEDKFAKLGKLKAAGEKQALAAWDPVYYAQAVLYMAYVEAPRHYLTVSSPGARRMIGVRTDADLGAAGRLRDRAERIIHAATPPAGVSADPLWFECSYCPTRAVCHGGVLPAVNCRTCAHATPERTGDALWSCARNGHNAIPLETQRTGCGGHRYIPALVTGAEPIDASEADNWIEYRLADGRTFRNGAPGPGSFTSEELRSMDRFAGVGDHGAEALRATFGARHALAPPVFGRAA